MTGRSLLQHFPPPVLTELRSGRLLPLVGAGLSRNADVPARKKLPLWDELGRSLALDVPDYGFVGAADALSAFEYEFGRQELVRRLARELLIDGSHPGRAHLAFCRLEFARVVTTNFDFLLERAYDEIGRPCDVVLDEEQLALPTARTRTTLLKLHGDLRHPKRMVATEDDFDGFLLRYPVLATHLASLLIERVPLLIGYSLEDPDLRQVLAMLRDRLGSALPRAYALAVGASQATIARYERRGIKVINLPGSTSKYGSILAAAFDELGQYWNEHVLGESDFVDEAPLEQIETTSGGAGSRLCYFSVPLNLLPLYREAIFPLAQDAGLVPVSGFDVQVNEGNRLAAIGALIRRSRVALVDMTEQTGSVEFGMAVEGLGGRNVLLITRRSQLAQAPSKVAGMTVALDSEDRLEQLDGPLLQRLKAWFFQHAPATPAAGSEAQALLNQGHWRPALIAAMSDLERLLRETSQIVPASGCQKPRDRMRFTLRQAIIDAGAVIGPELRDRLLHWMGVRNVALHEGAEIEAGDAQQAVADVDDARALLMPGGDA